MDNQIFESLRYFAFFSYPPTAEELYVFLTKASKKAVFLAALNELEVKGNVLKKSFNSVQRYSLSENKSFFNIFKKREHQSQQKIQKVKRYLKLLNFIPSISFVAYSGSIALSNAGKRGDVDLFIVTHANQLWTGRFFAVFLAQLLNLRHPILSYRVCLNLFFDEQNLKIPIYKRNRYVAHEVLQMKPVINKNNTYERFLTENNWVYDLYPNGKMNTKNNDLRLHNKPLSKIIEWVLKKLQLNMLNRKLQEGKLTNTQLWLITEDFEKKMPRELVK